MNPVTARLLNQQLVCPQFARPEEVVSWMGAMQGQDYKMVRWAVATRTRKPSLKAFETAFNSGEIIGNWSPTSKDGGFDIFKPGLSISEYALSAAFDAYRRFARGG